MKTSTVKTGTDRRLDGHYLGLETPEYRRKIEILEIAFETKRLRDLCEKSGKARKTIGNEAAAALASRLADIDAADEIHEMPPTKHLYAPGPNGGKLVIFLHEDMALILVCNHVQQAQTGEGAVAWKNVSRVRVVEIGAYKNE